MEYLHRDLLLVVILGLEVGVIGGDVFFDVDSGNGDLLIVPPAINTHDSPISNGQWDSEDDNEEKVCLEPAMGNDGQDTFQHPGNAEDDSGQMEVVEFAIALSDADEGWVFYGRCLGYPYGRIDHGRCAWI